MACSYKHNVQYSGDAPAPAHGLLQFLQFAHDASRRRPGDGVCQPAHGPLQLLQLAHDPPALGDDGDENGQIVHGPCESDHIAGLLGRPTHEGRITLVSLVGTCRVQVENGPNDGCTYAVEVRRLLTQISCEEGVVGIISLGIEVKINRNRRIARQCLDVEGRAGPGR